MSAITCSPTPSTTVNKLVPGPAVAPSTCAAACPLILSRRHLPQAPPRFCQHLIRERHRDSRRPRQSQRQSQRVQSEAFSVFSQSLLDTFYFFSHSALHRSQPTAAGAVELRMICPPLVGAGMDVLLPKYFSQVLLHLQLFTTHSQSLLIASPTLVNFTSTATMTLLSSCTMLASPPEYPR